MRKTFKKIILLNKKEGETPLEALEKFRAKNKEYKDTKMTYAGRLDPMASGLLVILIGDEIKNKEKYLNLNKEYEFKILFGFATDTYDILGKVTKTARQDLVEIVKKDLKNNIKRNIKFFVGAFTQNYPIYSSKTVAGKALFQYAREGLAVTTPERSVVVQSLKFFKVRTISKAILLKNIKKRIAKVKGDFRQKEILKTWKQILVSQKKSASRFFLADFHIKCGSGTYVRAIANDLGSKIGIPALALKIKRTKIGKWKL